MTKKIEVAPGIFATKYSPTEEINNMDTSIEEMQQWMQEFIDEGDYEGAEDIRYLIVTKVRLNEQKEQK